MSRLRDISLTALAPAIWGSTYIVTTQLLPAGVPLTVATLRALPAGLLLLVMVRELPQGAWWWKNLVLGLLNFSLFWAFLFVSAYRLPGGVAATVGAVQPLIVIALSRVVMGTSVRPFAVVAGMAGLCGVALLVLRPGASLDPIGIAAGLAGALSMAFGTVLSRHWKPPVSPLTFTAWQLTAGGLMLAPAALLLEPGLPPLTIANLAGFLSRAGRRGLHLYPVVSRPPPDRRAGGISARLPEPSRCSPSRLEPAGTSTRCGATGRRCRRAGQRLGKPARVSCPKAELTRATLLNQAHSPLRITGTRVPSGFTPSISTLSEPIIQSMWIRLEFPPCALICSCVSDAPSRKHFE